MAVKDIGLFGLMSADVFRIIRRVVHSLTRFFFVFYIQKKRINKPKLVSQVYEILIYFNYIRYTERYIQGVPMSFFLPQASKTFSIVQHKSTKCQLHDLTRKTQAKSCFTVFYTQHGFESRENCFDPYLGRFCCGNLFFF